MVGAGHEAKTIQKEKGAQIESPGHGQIETPGKSRNLIAWKSLRGSGAPNLDKARCEARSSFLVPRRHHGRARLQGPSHINAPLKRHRQWHRSVTTDIEEALGELGPEFATRMLEWREWLDKRPRSQADAESFASLPGWGDWPRRPVDGASAAGAGPADIARSRVLASSVTIVAPRRITSSVGDGAEGIAASQKRTRLMTNPVENQR